MTTQARISPKPHLTDLYRGVATQHSRSGYLRLDLNESADSLPEEFVRSASEKITPETLSMYPEYEALIQDYAAYENLASERVLPSNGSDGAIKWLFEAFVSPGDQILFTDPTFAMYGVYCSIYQATGVEVPYASLETFPYDAFLERIKTGGIRMAVVVNPNNPTGSSLDQSRIREIAEECDRQQTLLIVDEAYFHYLEETSLPMARSMDNVIVLRTFSKMCALATLRLGFVIGHPDLVNALRKVKTTFEVNGLAVLFARELLRQPEIIAAMKEKVERGRAWLCRQLENAAIRFRAGSGNFILIHCPQGAQNVVAALNGNGILVAHGFRHPQLEDYIRINIGDVPIMERFWDSFRQLFNA